MRTSAAPADADQMLDHHRLVREAAHRIAAQSWHQRNVSIICRAETSATTMSVTAREGVVRGAQEHAAQAHEVARDREIDHRRPPSGSSL